MTIGSFTGTNATDLPHKKDQVLVEIFLVQRFIFNLRYDLDAFVFGKLTNCFPWSQASEMTTLITGGTGFVGRELCKRLDRVTITSRRPSNALKDLNKDVEQVIQWDPSQPLALPQENHYQSVVNLMGESIAEGRWNPEKKKRIRDSRVNGTRRLVDAIIESGKLPDVFVSASAIGIYGDTGEDIVEEDHACGTGFLADVCEQWEQEAMRLQTHNVRVVCLRIGIVLGGQGGALKKMVPIFRWGLGGNLGSGKQWVAWIHVEDMVSLIQWSIENNSVTGPVNATAPNPVRNKELTKTLASVLKRPAFLPAPKFALRLALGKFAESLLFSQRVVPAFALNHGFQFQFSDLEAAIKDTVK